MELTVNWIGPDGEEEIIHIVYVGDDLYISTEMIKTLGALIFGDEAADLLKMLGDSDYLKLNVSDIADMAGLAEIYNDGDFASLLENLEDVDFEAIQGAMSSALRDAIDKSLGKEFEKALQEKDGEYILTLNTATAIEFVKAVLQMCLNHDAEIIGYFADIAGMFDEKPSDKEIKEAKDGLRETAGEALEFISDEDFIKMIPVIDFEYRVKAEGKDKDKTMTASTWLEIPTETIDTLNGEMEKALPFSKIEVSVKETSAIHTEAIKAPKGKVFPIDDLISGAIGSIGESFMADFPVSGFGGVGSNAEAMLNSLDLEQIISDFGIDLSQFNINLNDIDINNIDLSQFEGWFGMFDFSEFMHR
jgi:hypothetical protein